MMLLAEDEVVRNRIDDIITRLIKLSRQIGEHRKIKRDAIASEYEPYDKDGPLVESYAAHLEWRLNESKEKLSAGFMKDRMRATMMARWRKVSYYAAQLSRNRSVTAPSNVSGRLPKEPRVLNQMVPDTNRELPILTAVQESPGENFQVSTGPRSHGLTLSTGFKPHLDKASMAPSRNTKSLIGARLSEFPKPPEPLSASHEFRCPFCGILQPHSMSEPTSWR